MVVGLAFGGVPALGGAEPFTWFSPEFREARAHRAALLAELAAMGPPQLGQTAPQLGYQRFQVRVPPIAPSWVQLDLHATHALDRIALIPATTEIQPDRGAFGFPRAFRVDVSEDASFREFTQVYAHAETDPPPPGLAPVVIPVRVNARYLRITVSKLAEANGWHFYALAEIMALQGNRNLALGASVTASNRLHVADRWAPAYLVDGRTPLGPPICRAPLPEFDALFAAATATEPFGWMTIDLGETTEVDEVRLHPLHSWQGSDTPGYRFPLRFRIEIDATESFASPVVFFATGAADFPNPGNNPVTVRGPPVRGRYVRFVCTLPAPPPRDDFALSEMEVYFEGRHLSAGRPVTTSDYPQRERARPPAMLTDGLTSLGRLLEWPEWLDRWERRSRALHALAAVEARLPRLEQAARRRAAFAAVGAGLAAVCGGVAGFWLVRARRVAEQRRFREQLARDLHDEIGSNLAGIAVLGETAALRAAPRDVAVAAEFQEIQRIARESGDAMREVLWLVGAPHEGGIDLAQHFRRVAARVLPETEVVWTGLPEVFPAGWPASARRELFLFFKEALANIARHARATRVEITLGFTPAFMLAIQDNGCGFDPAGASGGLGLQSLRARAAALRGTVDFARAAGGGTRVELRAPEPAA